jgi:predicted nucleic acid-binding protein
LIVIDASAMVFALSSPSAQGDAARAVLAQDDLWLAPAHMPLEVIRTLRKATVSGAITEADAAAAYQALAAAEITYIGTTPPLLAAVWEMRHNVTAYDAAYLAVAAQHQAQLVTLDNHLAKAAEQVAPLISIVLI